MLVRILITLAILFPLIPSAKGQDVESVDFFVQDNKIIVTYSLLYCQRDYTYDLALYYWKDGQVNRAYAIEGDVQQQECGGDKKITWDVLADLESLDGKIKMEVRKVAEHKVARQKVRREKDHGYIGLMIGGFTPYKNFTPQFSYPFSSDNLQSPGASVELTGSWLGRRQGLLGYTSSLRLATSDITEGVMMEETSWVNGSFAFGPLISIPFSRRVVWDLRPMLGYCHTFVTGWSESSVYYNSEYEPVDAGSICYQLGTAFRLNAGKWFSFIFAADYFQTQPKFHATNINMNYLTFSFGCGIRF